MWTYPEKFGVIVVGAGHAGCEAAYISAKKGVKTLLLTMNLDTIAKPSCNPSIGGTAKGHIVREIDALGGIMAKITDRSAIHYRMLNASKGPAVQSPRAQIDKTIYHLEMKKFLESLKNLEIKQKTVESIIVENNRAIGITTLEGVQYLSETIILTPGTFLNGKIFIGSTTFSGGRLGEKASKKLATNLKNLFKMGKLKTGTPPRIDEKTIDFSLLKIQKSDKNVKFSFDPIQKQTKEIDCYITYTTEKSEKIIRENLKKCPLFSGKIKGVGPRYCPSIEDKIIRFPDKKRHQIFLEKEGLNTNEFYVNGLSSSMPIEIQTKILQSIKGLEKAKILRYAYAIEYDYVKSGQIFATLETKKIKNLFLAGQINGTTGYEEAAGQGLLAGINAANKVLKEKSFYLKRSNSYLGVMISDLISKELLDPYRMFTSRAEYRLLLRQDNADLRLFEVGFKQNLIDFQKYEKIKRKKEIIESEMKRFLKTYKTSLNKKLSLFKILSRPEINYSKLLKIFPEDIVDYKEEINKEIELEVKYSGYIKRQKREIEKLKHLEKIKIPKNFNFNEVLSLRNEAKEKLTKFSPPNLLLASNISGISPADISILMVTLKNSKFSC
jgi:tRNA uridine 5-carboxymethylaminomethyl modification enzyme